MEGENRNDWTEFERQSAKRQAQIARKRKWPDFILKSYPNPLEEKNYISGRACDHYNRFREDFDIAESLGHNAHRFSIEWSRIEPEEGKFNEKEIEHYREVVRALRERGMEPFVTLWHWTLPVWFSQKGGWESAEARSYFLRYAEKICAALKDDVRFWITLNEPGAWAAQAYLFGMFPPGKINFFAMVRVYLNLLHLHKETYRMLKKTDPRFFVGLAESMEWYEVSFVRRIIHYFRDYYFVDHISNELDFIGINFYKVIGLRNNHPFVSDLGWKLHPRFLYSILKKFQKYQKPIFITENGLADARDALRGRFIKEHISWVAKAIGEGVDVRGYFHWSLLDNFEWDSGFWPRFGLVEVDYKTMERKIRPSAREYGKIIRQSKNL